MTAFLYLFIAIIAVLFHSGDCISCYNCLSKNSKECLNPNSYPDFKPQQCNMEQINHLADKTKEIAQQLGNAFGVDIHPAKSDANIPIVCQKIVTTVGSERVIVRGCQLPSGGDMSFCDNMKKIQDTVITHCSLCDTDGCNSGHWLAPLSFISLLLPVLGVTIWTVYTA